MRPHIRPFLSATIAGFILSLGYRQAHAADFALVPPAVIARLKTEADSPAGKTAIAQANEALHRAPGPIPVMHVEGILAHQGLWDATLKAQLDLPLMRSFGLAYAMTGERGDLDAADDYFKAWLDIYAPSFNPIDETSLDPWFVAYDLTRAHLPADTRAKMDVFLRRDGRGVSGPD